MANYIAQFNITWNPCSNVKDIEAKFLFKENLWAKKAVQVMNCQITTLKDSQVSVKRTGSILKHAGVFNPAKKKE